MSRSFAPNDQLTYNNASGDGTNNAFGTVLVIVKITAANGSWQSFLERNTGGTGNYGLGRHSSNNIFSSNQSSASQGGASITSADGWMLVAAVKATGSATPTHYKIPLGGSTTTGSGDTSLANCSTGTGSVTLGGPSDFATMLLAVAAIFKDITLSQANLETIASVKTTQQIIDLGATWVVDDGDSFAADLVGSVDLTSDSGTSDDADDPSGWVFGLSGGGSTYTKAGAGISGP